MIVMVLDDIEYLIAILEKNLVFEKSKIMCVILLLIMGLW